MVAALRRRGYPRDYLLAIDLRPDDAPNVEAAEKQIAPAVERLLARANALRRRQAPSSLPLERIDIVSHSMGGVSTRWYITRLAPHRVATWISLAGPNHGSDVGCPGRVGSGKAELCPAFASSPGQSPVQFTLNGAPGPDIDETPFGIGEDDPQVERVPPDRRRNVLYITLRIRDDEYVQPAESVVLDGAGGLLIGTADLPLQQTTPGNFLLLADVEHDSLPHFRPALELVARVLAAPRPSFAAD